MRLFLQSILAFASLLMCFACSHDEPNVDNPTPGDKVEGVLHFSDEMASQRALSVSISSDDPDMEYIVLLAQKKHFIINGIDTERKLLEDDFYYIKSLADSM